MQQDLYQAAALVGGFVEDSTILAGHVLPEAALAPVVVEPDPPVAPPPVLPPLGAGLPLGAAAAAVAPPLVDLSAVPAAAPPSDKKKRRPWSEPEEERLRQGVLQHGAGSWAKIRDQCGFKGDPATGDEGRSCVNLKDKWRNLQRAPRADGRPKITGADALKGGGRKKKARPPKRKREGDDGGPRGPPKWLEAAASWCRGRLVRADKGKVHVGALRDKFASDPAFFPDVQALVDDGEDPALLAEDLRNPKTEASKKFRTEALEPVVGKASIRQNCFINGLNQLGVFGWCVEGEDARPPARSPADKLRAAPPAPIDLVPSLSGAVVAAASPLPHPHANLADLGAPRLNVGPAAAAPHANLLAAQREADAAAAAASVVAVVPPDAPVAVVEPDDPAIVEPEDDFAAASAPLAPMPTPVPAPTPADTTVLRVPEPRAASAIDELLGGEGVGVAHMLSTYVPTPP